MKGEYKNLCISLMYIGKVSDKYNHKFKGKLHSNPSGLRSITTPYNIFKTFHFHTSPTILFQFHTSVRKSVK